MLGRFFFDPPVYVSPEETKRREVAFRARAPFVPWDPDTTKWEPELRLLASTYHPRRFFNVEPTSRQRPAAIEADAAHRAMSADAQWMYVEKILPPLTSLAIYTGRREGKVLWDDTVIIPALFDKRWGDWRDLPFMSLTPFEYLTLRAGTRLAKGRVVVAGLGLGHQLIEVSRRKQVKEIVLVEQSQSLVDFILPEVSRHLGPVPVQVIVGDAYQEMQSISADVALVDIFPGYGGNDFEQDKLRRTCKFIDTIWCWGAGKR